MKGSIGLVGERIRAARQARGLSRAELARKLDVDSSAIAAWETGRNLPRATRRVSLARILSVDVQQLFSEIADKQQEILEAKIVSALPDMPSSLLTLLSRTQRRLRIVHPAVPNQLFWAHATEYRKRLRERLTNGTLEVQRLEYFYGLDRLKEVIFNIFEYEGLPYQVRGTLVGDSDEVPSLAVQIFDDDEFMFGSYWATIPANEQYSLQCRGEAFRSFFLSFWNEAWRRGAPLNDGGPKDLRAIQNYAFRLGLKPEKWTQFVKEARELDLGDGAAPAI